MAAAALPAPQGMSLGEAMSQPGYRADFEAALPAFLRSKRWFADRHAAVLRVTVEDCIPLGPGGDAVLAVVGVDGVAHRSTYQLPLTAHPGAPAAVVDALESPGDAEAFLASLLAGGSGSRLAVGLVDGASLARPGPARIHEGEQSNTSVIFGDACIMKLFRRLSPGRNPDVELTSWLSGPGGFPNVPRTLAWARLDLRGGSADSAVVQEYLPHEGDGWAWALGLATAAAHAVPNGSPFESWLTTTPGRELLDGAASLGETTARLHLALAAAGEDGLRPASFSTADWDVLKATVRHDIDEAIELTTPSAPGAAPMLQTLHRAVPLEAFDGGLKTRVHGDYHLGQVLRTPRGWVIVDFEGEPSRPLVERVALQHPLVDVAGMVRSWDYAAASAAGPAAAGWAQAATRAFLDSYWAAAADASFVPRDEAARQAILRLFVLRKALYELRYELGSRPAWVRIPLAALDALAKDVQ